MPFLFLSRAHHSIPRLCSALLGTLDIALLSTAGEEEYLLTLADASFVFVRASSLKISRSIARIKLGEHSLVWRC